MGRFRDGSEGEGSPLVRRPDDPAVAPLRNHDASADGAPVERRVPIVPELLEGVMAARFRVDGDLDEDRGHALGSPILLHRPSS